MVTLENVSFWYQKKRPIFRDLSMQLNAGGIYGILGANGVGKTTLLHLIAGLNFPKQGQISVNNQPAHSRAVNLLERIYYVPVDFELPRTTVDGFRDRYAPFYPKFDAMLWQKSINTFAIDARQPLRALSFGQKKKVLISFGIASGVELLLLDEPTDGLDIPSKDNFRKILSGLVDETRMVLITTHHINDVASLLDHIVVFDQQQLLLNAPVNELSARMRSVSSTTLADAAVLYSERIAGGYSSLLVNAPGEEGTLDLELLFKALYHRPDLIRQVIAGQFDPKNLH